MYNIFKVYLSPTDRFDIFRRKSMTKLTIKIVSHIQVGNKEYFSHESGEKKFVLLDDGVLIMAPATTKHSEMQDLAEVTDADVVVAGNFRTHYDVGDNDWQLFPRVTCWGSTSLGMRNIKVSDRQDAEINKFLENHFTDK